MQLTKEGARYVDDFLQNLQNKFDANGTLSMTVLDYIHQDGNTHKPYEEIYYAFILANYIQNRLGFKAFQMNIIDDKPHIDYQKGFTDAFLVTGGFTTIWQNEEDERTERLSISKSIKETNSSTRATNTISRKGTIAQKNFTKIIMWATIASAFVAGSTLIKDLACNSKPPTKIEITLTNRIDTPKSGAKPSQTYPKTTFDSVKSTIKPLIKK